MVTITILVIIFIITVATIGILFIIVIFNGQGLVALRQFRRIHFGVFSLSDCLFLLRTMKTNKYRGTPRGNFKLRDRIVIIENRT